MILRRWRSPWSRVMTSMMRSSSTASRRMMDVARIMSEQEVALSHGKHPGGLADEQLAVGAHVVGFGIDLDDGRGVVEDHALLADAAANVLDRHEGLLHGELSGKTVFDGGLRL